ncbi:UDP-glycosyltransferase 86A1 [Sesamum alatum]|uniref:UDP-glycosyltransferase 86A1 n=1 Tax=Sesamum alatum TaxID=300844 RepID=A0AAE2CJY5_9LAMI|nr:UDP-glycosyltransferase 86A1 [Sesamum alatum]
MVNVSLWTSPAIVLLLNYHLELLRQNGHVPFTGNTNNHIKYIPGIQSITTKDLMTYLQDPEAIPVFTRMVEKSLEQVKKADFILCNTVEELESKALSALSQKHPTYAIGPINFFSDITQTSIAKSLCIGQSSKEEIEELAHGILLSQVYFVWVVRSNIIGGNGSDIFPKGFEDVVKDKGLIVPWCNQNMVLSSSATGGFLTHCGWNSILESIWHGVPMICYPFLVDQPTNRKLVVDDWKIGIDLFDGEQVGREEVASKISILMRGENSIRIKQQVKKLSKKLHESLDAEGSSYINFNRFIEDLEDKLCVGKP